MQFRVQTLIALGISSLKTSGLKLHQYLISGVGINVWTWERASGLLLSK